MKIIYIKATSFASANNKCFEYLKARFKEIIPNNCQNRIAFCRLSKTRKLWKNTTKATKMAVI